MLKTMMISIVVMKDRICPQRFLFFFNKIFKQSLSVKFTMSLLKNELFTNRK